MSNETKAHISASLYNVGFMFCTGAIVQTFLLQIGFSAQQVYFYNSIAQMAQVLMMIMMIFISPRIKKVKLVTGLSYMSLLALALVLLIAAISPSIAGSTLMMMIFGVSALCFLGTGVYSVMSYCIPYYTIDMSNYARFISLQMVYTGVATFIFSSIHTFATSKFEYMNAMAIFFALAVVFFILAFVFCISMKENKELERTNGSSKEDYIAVFKNKDTYILLIPNFTRGLATGVVAVIAVIAISSNIVDEQSSAYINIVMQVAMFTGNLFYAAFCKKLSTTKLLLISAIGGSVFLPICLAFDMWGFLVVFFIAYFFRMILDTAFPVVVTEIIPREQIGAYTSIRMLVFTGAQAVAALLITPIVEFVGYVGLLIFASAMQFICAIVYFVVARKRRKEAELKVDN